MNLPTDWEVIASTENGEAMVIFDGDGSARVSVPGAEFADLDESDIEEILHEKYRISVTSSIAWEQGESEGESVGYFEYEYDFDPTTLHSGVILDILNNYPGSNIWEDVITRFDFEMTPVGDIDAFIMKDYDGDTLRFYYSESDKGWTWRLNDEFEEAA